MANHIAKINRNNPFQEPVLATSYIRFQPVPEKWQEVLVHWKEWKADTSEDKEPFDHEKLEFIKRAIEDYTSDIAEELGINGNLISSEITLDEGSIVFEVFFGLFTYGLLTPETIEVITELFKSYQEGKEIDPDNLQKGLLLLYADLKAIERTVKKIVSSLGGFLKAHIKGGKNNTMQVRFGTLKSLIRFDSSFRRAVDNPNVSLEERSEHLFQAVKQLDMILKLTEEKKIREIYYYFVILRTKGDLKKILKLDNRDDKVYFDSYNLSIDNLQKKINLMIDEL